MENILFSDEKIIETNYFTIEQDREVPIPWFFILSAKKSLKSIADFTESEALDFIRLLHKCRLGMRDVLKIENIALYQNEATEHNFHVRIFPWHERMKKIDYKKVQSIFPIMNHAKEHMTNEDIIQEVKLAVQKMKEYMKR